MKPSARPDSAAQASTCNLSAESLDFFERSWDVYHRIVADDLMEHAGLFTALDQRLQQFLEGWGTAPLTMADLACGDLTTLAPLLRRLPLDRFTGVDASASVLALARERLAEMVFPCDWVLDDLLRWSGQPGERFALVTCLYGLHHLADADKRRFLASVPQRLEPGGLLVIADIFREPGESRRDYLQRYVRRIRDQWQTLDPSLQDHVVAHISGSDFPAERDAFLVMAAETGWQADWIWRGSHRAEALLGLQYLG